MNLYISVKEFLKKLLKFIFDLFCAPLWACGVFGLVFLGSMWKGLCKTYKFLSVKMRYVFPYITSVWLLVCYFVRITLYSWYGRFIPFSIYCRRWLAICRQRLSENIFYLYLMFVGLVLLVLVLVTEWLSRGG